MFLDNNISLHFNLTFNDNLVAIFATKRTVNDITPASLIMKKHPFINKEPGYDFFMLILVIVSFKMNVCNRFFEIVVFRKYILAHN